MAVPAFAQFFPVVFRALADTQGPLSHRELRQRCIETFHLTQNDIAETIASGQSRLTNRVYWVVSYCRMAGLWKTQLEVMCSLPKMDDAFMRSMVMALLWRWLRDVPGLLSIKKRLLRSLRPTSHRISVAR